MATMMEQAQRVLYDEKMLYMSGDLSQDNFDECIQNYCDIYLENAMNTLKYFKEEVERMSHEEGDVIDFSKTKTRRALIKALNKKVAPYKWSSLLYKFYLYIKSKRVDEAKDVFDQLNEMASELSVDYLDHNHDLVYDRTGEDLSPDEKAITKGEGAFILIMNQIRNQLDNAKFMLDIIS